MSMSTNIADLPGPAPEEYEQEMREEFEDAREQREQREQRVQEQDIKPPPQQQRPIAKEALYEQPSRIKMDVKKIHKKQQEKVEEQSMFSLIKSEVSEENLLILVVLYIASTSLIDEYVRKLLSLASFNPSSFAVNILKCVILLLVFILAKHFLLPYIRV